MAALEEKSGGQWDLTSGDHKCFMTIHPIVRIFQSGPRCWPDIATHRENAASLAKNDYLYISPTLYYYYFLSTAK